MKKSSKKIRDIGEQVGLLLLIALLPIGVGLITVVDRFSRLAPESLALAVTIYILFFMGAIALFVLSGVLSSITS